MAIKPSYGQLEEQIKELERILLEERSKVSSHHETSNGAGWKINKGQQAEDVLREIRKDWEKIIDAVDDWITLIDLDSTIIRSNRTVERLFKLKVQESIGLTCCNLAHGSDTPIKECPLPRAMQTKKRESVEIKLTNGRWVLITVDPIFNKEEEMVSAVHTVRDITENVLIRNERKKLIKELQNALAQVKTLSGLIPICSGCKKIRDDKGYWNIIESYIQSHSDAEFSHSMCPECSDKLYGKEDWYIRMKKKKKKY